jgi:hypothetical protein
MAVKINGAPLLMSPEQSYPIGPAPVKNLFDKFIPPNPLTQVKPAVAAIMVEKKDHGVTFEEEHKEEVLNPGVMGVNLCEVLVEGGRTINLGNFESTRISVAVKMPCTKDGLNATYDEAVAWVDERLTVMVNMAKKPGA